MWIQPFNFNVTLEFFRLYTCSTSSSSWARRSLLVLRDVQGGGRRGLFAEGNTRGCSSWCPHHLLNGALRDEEGGLFNDEAFEAPAQSLVQPRYRRGPGAMASNGSGQGLPVYWRSEARCPGAPFAPQQVAAIAGGAAAAKTTRSCHLVELLEPVLKKEPVRLNEHIFI